MRNCPRGLFTVHRFTVSLFTRSHFTLPYFSHVTNGQESPRKSHQKPPRGRWPAPSGLDAATEVLRDCDDLDGVAQLRGLDGRLVLGADGRENLLVYDCRHGHHRLVHHQRPIDMLQRDFEDLSKWKVVDLGYGDGAFAIANQGQLNDDAGMCLLYFDRDQQTFAVKNMDDSLHDNPAACCRFRFHSST